MTKKEAKKMLQAEKSCYENQVTASGCNIGYYGIYDGFYRIL